MIVELNLRVKQMDRNISTSQDQTDGIALRIRHYLDSQNVSEQSFANDTQFGRKFDKGVIGKAITPKDKETKMGTYVIEKFLRRFPEVNPYWLLFGEGEIIIDRKLMTVHENYFKLENAYIAALRDTIGKLENNLNDVRGQVKDKEKIIKLLEASKT